MHRLRAEVGCGFFNTKVEWCASPLITLSWTFLSQSYFRLDLNECVSRGNTKSDSVMRAFGAAMRARVDTMVPAWWVTPPSPSVRRPRPFKHQSSWAHRVRSWARLAALWLSSRVDPQPPLEASRTWCSDLKKKSVPSLISSCSLPCWYSKLPHGLSPAYFSVVRCLLRAYLLSPNFIDSNGITLYPIPKYLTSLSFSQRHPSECHSITQGSMCTPNGTRSRGSLM